MCPSRVHWGSAFEPGASGLPYYCIPPVCVPDVLGALAVWRQNMQTKKKPGRWGGEETSASTYFWLCDYCRLFFSLNVVLTLTEGIICWMFRLHIRYYKNNLGALDSPGCHNHSRTTTLPLSYIIHSYYNSPTTHQSRPIYTIDELTKRKRKRNKGGLKKQKTQINAQTRSQISPSTKTHDNKNTNKYETYIHYQHTNTSLHNNSPHSKYITKKQHTLKTQKTKRQHKLKTQNRTKHNTKIIIILQIITILKSTTNIQIDHFQTTFRILNTLPTYKYIHFKTTFMCPRSILGVPSRQALSGFLITAHYLCVFLM